LSFDSDEDEMKDIIEVIVFMLLLFVIYMIVLLYGQKICSEVSMEKSSKLVEQLLTSVTPYGLVAGKVFAVILTSLIQFIIWIVAAIWGIFGGDAMAKMLYPNYESKVDYALNMIRELFGMMAFDKAAVVMSIVLMLVGIIFYLVLAGFAGSFVTKPENAASVQMLFVMPIVISFMIDLIQLVNGEGSVSVVLHFIPFTAAMITPGAMLLGAIPLWMGIVSAVISIIGAMLLMYVAAKIYKALLFFNGAKLTPKLVLGMFKAKK
jgi:ABC-type Na+ efflux pump permease subunit